jgi:hypothetical protein
VMFIVYWICSHGVMFIVFYFIIIFCIGQY